MHHRLCLHALAALALCAAAAGAGAQQQMFRCGATYQDRPCASENGQKRYSPGASRFESPPPARVAIDKLCVLRATQFMPYWRRLRDGSVVEAVEADLAKDPNLAVAAADVPAQRTALQALRGTPAKTQAALEAQCMRDLRAGRLQRDTGAVAAALPDAPASPPAPVPTR